MPGSKPRLLHFVSGQRQANKAMHLSAIAYNLKKHLKSVQKRVKSGAGALSGAASVKLALQTCSVSVPPDKKWPMYIPGTIEKGPLKRLISVRFSRNYRLVQRLPLLGNV